MNTKTPYISDNIADGETITSGIPAGSFSAAAIANAFLALQEEDDTNFPLIDPIKLQKLLFYAQAWWLASTDTELFPDDIKAWTWGPVVPGIYYQFEKFGKEPIRNKQAEELIKTGKGILDVYFRVPPAVPQSILSFLKNVWKTHKKFTGIQLSNATHGPGEPWTIVKKRYGSLDNKPRIPNELIRDVFKAKFAD